MEVSIRFVALVDVTSVTGQVVVKIIIPIDIVDYNLSDLLRAHDAHG